jgi:hypothetical protein
MRIDLRAASDFMAAHARVLDRRRFDLLEGWTDAGAVLAALDGYRNPDGGYGWGLEPDLRSPESQPGPAHHAFEVFEETAPARSTHAAALCDWLDSVTHADGGLPFALPLTVSAGSARWWTAADASESFLQITAVVAAAAHRIAAYDPAVATHPWLRRATDYCLTAIDSMKEPPFAYALAFSIRLLDAMHASRSTEADALLDRLGSLVPDDGTLPVTGGAENEALHPLDIAPYPESAARRLFTDGQIAADLDRLAGLQQDDGGWIVEFPSASPAGALEWRGYATVRAVDVLRRASAA